MSSHTSPFSCIRSGRMMFSRAILGLLDAGIEQVHPAWRGEDRTLRIIYLSSACGLQNERRKMEHKHYKGEFGTMPELVKLCQNMQFGDEGDFKYVGDRAEPSVDECLYALNALPYRHQYVEYDPPFEQFKGNVQVRYRVKIFQEPYYSVMAYGNSEELGLTNKVKQVIIDELNVRAYEGDDLKDLPPVARSIIEDARKRVKKHKNG